jgi:hypothetical protein
MLKRLAILATWLICAGIMAGQGNKNAGPNPHPTKQEQPASIVANGEQSQPKAGNEHGEADSVPPGRDAPFKWPQWMHDSTWWLVIVAGCTGLVIGWQAWETRKAAQGAQVAADAARLNAQAFINAERPWILVKAEPSKRREFGWELIAVNKGRTPAEVVAQADNCIALDIMASLPDIAEYGKSKIYPTPQIILPDEPFVIGEITQYSLFKNDQASITRFRNVETEGYVYGSIIYLDLLSPPSAEPHETRWCFSILPWQDQGMLLQEHGWGGNEYTRHT